MCRGTSLTTFLSFCPRQELDSRESVVQELMADKDSMHKKLTRLEIKFKQMEKDKNDLIQVFAQTPQLACMAAM
jgi:hypothetical protein